MALYDDIGAITAHLRYVFKHKDEMGMSQRVLLLPESAYNDHDDVGVVPRTSPDSYDITLSFGTGYFADDPQTTSKHSSGTRTKKSSKKNVYRRTSQGGPVPSRRATGWDESEFYLDDSDTDQEETPTGDSERFTRQPVAKIQPRTKPSGLTLLRQRGPAATIDNPFSRYYELSGEGQVKDLVSKITVFFQGCRLSNGRYYSVDVVILKRASVQDVVGLAMYMYTEAQKKPDLRPDPDSYVLRMLEDDGEPDMDLPPLDATQRIARFGFDSLCLCKGANFEVAEKEQGTPKFVRVEHADSGTTILKRVLGMTVGDVLDQTLKKRGLRAVDYVLENKRYPGKELDLTMRLTTLESSMSKAGLELLLIRKHSKRKRNQEEEEALAAAKVSHTLEMYQSKTYIVSRLQKFGTQTVELVIASDKINITPYGKNFLSTRAKAAQLGVDNVVECAAVDRKPTQFTLTYLHPDSQEFKTAVYEAKSSADALEIVTKTSAILKYRVSDEHDAVVNAYLRKNGSNK